MLELDILIRGRQYSICALRAPGRRRSYVEEYLAGLQKPDQRKLWSYLKRVADNGPPPNDEMFKWLRGQGHGLCEFKRKPHRLIGFRVRNTYILTNGFKKKDDEPPEEEILRGQRLKAMYFEQSGN